MNNEKREQARVLEDQACIYQMQASAYGITTQEIAINHSKRDPCKAGAAALCIERAEQMERGEQGFEEWYGERHRLHLRREVARDVWQAATAQMQARVDATITHLEKTQAEVEAWVAENTQLHGKLDAAQKRVAELEGWRGRASGIEKQVAYSHYKVFGDRNYAYSGPHEAIDLLAAECITCAKERNKARDALATAERERELLRVEVRRCHHIANKVRTHTAEVAHSISEKILTDCSPEVRALVDHADPSNATG